MLNEHIWLAIAFALFVVLFIKYAMPHLINSIDAKSKAVADEIENAKKMTAEAKILLEKAEEYYQESVHFAEKIIRNAEEDSRKTIESAQKTLEAEISKKTDAVMNRLKTEEEHAIRQVKSQIIEKAMENIQANIANDLGEKEQDNLVEKALNDVAQG